MMIERHDTLSHSYSVEMKTMLELTNREAAIPLRGTSGKLRAQRIENYRNGD